MDEKLISQIQRFTLDTRHQLEREVSEQLEGIYGWLPDGTFARAEGYPALNQIEEARQTRFRLESYAKAEKEAGFDFQTARKKLIREASFTWLNRFIAFRMMEERRLIKETISRLWESNAYKFWLADGNDLEALGLYEKGEIPVNSMGEGPRHISYRRFILWQCKELSREVPVLFDSETICSRLFPRPGMLKSLISSMNEEKISEAWKSGNEETIGWVYASFNSEEKDATFAGFQKNKKVEPDQIAPATQVFTPRWVVRYLVENSLGRLWIEMHPDSRLQEKLGYLVPLPKEVRRPLKPVKNITFLDPACGSMHFGLVAFDVYVEMYKEEIENAGKPGWPETPSVASIEDIPSAIIENNIHGIDIDLRAVQLSALTLFIKARMMNPKCSFTDRNLACANIEKITGGHLEEFINQSEFSHPIYERVLRQIAIILKDSDNLGSLLRPEKALETLISDERIKADKTLSLLPGIHPERFTTKEVMEEFFNVLQGKILDHLDTFVKRSIEKNGDGSHFVSETTKGLRFVRLVHERYDVVATNPPYMSRRNQSAIMANFLDNEYPSNKSDLYAAFIRRSGELTNSCGKIAMITQQSFMFISSYEQMRADLRDFVAIESMIHLGPKAFPEVTGEKVNTTAFVFRKETDEKKREESVGVYFRLVRERDSESKRLAFESALSTVRAGKEHPLVFHYAQKDFDAIPGKPWVYWMPQRLRNLFETLDLIENVAKPRQGLATADNKRFLRKWWEVGKNGIGFGCSNAEETKKISKKWFPYMKGGTPSPWFGNQENVVDWLNNGAAIRCFGEEGGYIRSRPQNIDFYFCKGVTWSDISSKGFAARLSPGGFIHDVTGMTCFPKDEDILLILGLLNSRIAKYLLSAINPTIHYQVGDIERLPVPSERSEKLSNLVNECVELAKEDSRESEITYDFVKPLKNLEVYGARKALLEEKEAEIDREVSRLYGLTEEDLTAIDRELSGAYEMELSESENETADEEKNEAAIETISPEDWARSWISYAVGIVLGRFEIGVPEGLGRGDFPQEVNEKLKKLSASDGVLVNDPGSPLDLAARVWQALEIMLGEKEAEFRVATALGDGEPLELLSNWFNRFTGQPATSFWKYHFQLYRKRPIYWPLQSPKKEFTVWVFHERFTKDTLFHIRSSVVEPRLRLAEQQIADLKAKSEKDRRVRKQLDRLFDLSDDLREFSKRIKEITDRGYTPHLDDGVLLNASPLHEILPSWPETRKAWQELEAGEYDWAYQAMEYWPERVKEKCKTNRSFAIAHGLEELYEEDTTTPNKKRRKAH